MSSIIEIHQRVLEILENERETNTNLRYKPRQINKHNRLSKGYWFIGDDKYLMIGFAEGGDANEKIHNIGFSIKATGEAYLDFSAQDSEEDALFLGQLADQVGAEKWSKKNRWTKKYNGNYADELRKFLRTELKVINKAISSPTNKTQIQPISEENFDKYFKNINNYIVSQSSAVEKIARICWNSNGWKYPSGKFGKSKSKDSFENIKGFGHEEWLFDPSRTIGGYHYSFLQQINTKNKIHQGKIYTIHLFTVDPQNVKCYVGLIKNVECITDADSKIAQDTYKQKKWFKEMAEEVKSALGHKVSNTVNIKFNIRFKFSDVIIEEPMLVIDKKDPNTKCNHYVLMNKNKDILYSYVEETKGQCNLKNTSIRKRVCNVNSEFAPLHDRMQNLIVQILQKDNNYKSDSVKSEYNRVDIQAETTKGKRHFFELKTSCAKSSIRQALGQLLEYNHYPTVQKADELYIVSFYKPNTDDLNYMEYIRKTYNINIWYRYFDYEKEILDSNRY